VWLIGETHSEIRGSKLLSNRQVLARFFHLHLNEKHTIQDSAVSTVANLDESHNTNSTGLQYCCETERFAWEWKALKKGASNMSEPEEQTDCICGHPGVFA